MTHTIVGLFDHRDEARAACDALAAAGFEREGVSVHGHGDNEPDTPVPNTDYTDSNAQHAVMERVESFFSTLFGKDDRPEETGHYFEGVRRGGTLVAVEVTEDRAEAARTALWRAGAVDIEDRAQRWRADGYAGWDPAAQPLSPDEAQAERTRYAPGGAPRPDVPPSCLRAYERRL